MSNSILRRVAGFVLLSLLVLSGGCESKKPGESNLPKPDQSPQAKFDRIVETLHDKLGTDRHSAPSEAGTSTSIYSYTIDAPEKIKEAAPGTMPRATIKITQSSSYSFLPAKPKKEDEEAENEKQNSPTSPLGDTRSELEAMGVEVLDPSMVDEDLARAFAPKPALPDSSPRTIDNNTQVVYELVYEKDRWRLAVPPAADSMQATNMVMETALKRQN